MASAEITQGDLPDSRQPQPSASLTTVVAGADIQGISAGSQYADLAAVGQAFASRIGSLRNSRGGDGEQITVATINASAFPESRTLYPGDVEGNASKIRDVTSIDAIVAAGGYCAPLEVRYDLFGLGNAKRPVRDALPTFAAKRGGIRYLQAPTLGAYTGAVGLWTAEDDADAAEEAGPTKPCLTVECTPERTATVDAVTLCLQFGNLMSRAFPELITRHNELALIQHARRAETQLLARVNADSTQVTTGAVLSIARDWLHNLGLAGAAYRSRHRMDRTDPLRVIAPAWVRDLLREDLSVGLPGDKLTHADAEIDGYLSARGINVTWHLEEQFGAQAAAALLPWPSSFKWYMFSEGTFLALDGGTLDLGIVRDSGLVGTNDYRTFTETFETVVKVGIESLAVTSAIVVSGSVAATKAGAYPVSA